MKILFVIGQLDYGGAEKQLLYLAQGLKEKDFSILVCCLSANAAMKDDFIRSGIDLIIVPARLKPDFLSRPYHLYKIIKTFKPDIIHSYLFVANTWSRVLGAILKIPTVLSERSVGTFSSKAQICLNRLLCNFGDRLIANSKAGATWAAENLNYPIDKIRVIYNGYSPPAENSDLKLKNTLIQSGDLDIFGKEKIIGFIARLDKVKNHIFIIKLVENNLNYFENKLILFIGDGPLRSILTEEVKVKNLSSVIRFMGFREDVQSFYPYIDLTILPSLIEGLPNVIIESMLNRTLVLANKVGGIPELLEDGRTGLLAALGNEREFFEKLRYGLTDGKKKQNMIDSAYKFALAGFTLEAMIQSTISVYFEFNNNVR